MQIGETIKLAYGTDLYVVEIAGIDSTGITGRYRYLGSEAYPAKDQPISPNYTFRFTSIKSITPSDVKLDETKTVNLGLGLGDAEIKGDFTKIMGFNIPNARVLEVARAINGTADGSDFYVAAYGDKSVSVSSDKEQAKRLANSMSGPHVYHYRTRAGGTPRYLSRVT